MKDLASILKTLYYVNMQQDDDRVCLQCISTDFKYAGGLYVCLHCNMR